METQNNLANFASQENQRLEQEKEQNMRDRGFTPFYKITEGTHKLEFKNMEPRTIAKFPGKRYFQVMVEGEEKTISVNTKSPLYRDLVKHLSEGHFVLEIMRIGKKQADTRYSVKPV